MPYNLENLTWQEFEHLIGFYLKEKVGEGLFQFDGTADQGRDAAFFGTANEFPSKTEPYTGHWIFQVKHRTTRNQTIHDVELALLAALPKELSKIFNKHNFECGNYVYITNINVSNTYRDQAAAIFHAFCVQNGLQDRNFNVVEYKDIDIFLSKNSAVRFKFPSLLMFSDLEKIFLKKEEMKNKGRLKFAYERINRFVSISHYREAADRILNNDLLMLVGNPKSGKTNLVEALALCFLEEQGYKPYFIHNTEEFFAIASYIPEGEGVVFICDDIFGKHVLDEGKYADWANYFQGVMGTVDTNHKLIFTTRLDIYYEFERKSGLGEFFPAADDPTRYVIKLNELTPDEREQILDKHVNCSSLRAPIVEIVQQKKYEILGCKDFSPEVIRSLVSLLDKVPVQDASNVISKHIANPNQYLYDFFNNINIQKRLILLAMALAPSDDQHDVEGTFIRLLSDTNEKPDVVFQRFIQELDGSIVKRREYTDSVEIEYYHPTMGDAIIGIFKQDKHYRVLMLKNISLETLYLLTPKQNEKTQQKIHVEIDEFDVLITGMERLLKAEKSLSGVTTTLQWLGYFGAQVPHEPKLIPLFPNLKTKMRVALGRVEIFDMHATEAIEYWISLLDRWSLIPGKTGIDYAEALEMNFRNYRSFDYWRLVFLIEAVNPNFIQGHIDVDATNAFTGQLTRMVSGLHKGLNPSEKRLNTEETWLPLFQEIDDLILKMKRSTAGRRIIETHFQDAWEMVKKYSETAKNRHGGMVKAGHWRTYRRLRNFKFLNQTVPERR